jgi:hypothetical protein
VALSDSQVFTKIIEQTLAGIDGSTLIQKLLNDFNKGKKGHQKKETYDKLGICIAIFLNGQHLRTHSFGKTKKENRYRSEERAELLIDSSHFRSANVQVHKGGALKADGLIISISGFGNEYRNEYASWTILNMVEHRLNEINQSFIDKRFLKVENNSYITEEIMRLKSINM